MRCSRLGAIALFVAAPAALNTAQSGAALGQTTKPALEWASCGDVPDTECAGLEVPVDYAKPNGAKFTLRLGRAPVVDPAKRKGVLLLLPGGPGPGITEMMGGDERKVQHVADFQQQYDVVTWDPRGIGKSSPIRCDPKAAPKVEMPLDHKPTQAEFDYQNSSPLASAQLWMRAALARATAISPPSIPPRTSSACARRCRPTTASWPMAARTARLTARPISKPIRST